MNRDICEYCDGTVCELVAEREVFTHKKGLVILKNVPIGVCNKCGSRYYSSKLLHEVDDIATGKRRADEEELVPIAEYS